MTSMDTKKLIVELAQRKSLVFQLMYSPGSDSAQTASVINAKQHDRLFFFTSIADHVRNIKK